jgi:hypothetical protein
VSIVADNRLKFGAERWATERPPYAPPARASGIIRRLDDSPPSSHRRLLGWLSGDMGCALCARRAAQGTAVAIGLARTSCQFLAATWVVLTMSDP